MIAILLPPLSASSHLNSTNSSTPKSFNFQFTTDSHSGALLLTAEKYDGFLELVKNSVHREPEDELETISNFIVDALNLSKYSKEYYSVRGCTDKDQTLVKCLQKKLHGSSTDLILPNELHPLEAQHLICSSSTDIVCKPGTILIIRHLLEHTLDLNLFLIRLRQIIRNHSFCYIEVPDSIGLFSNGDLTQLWEEHTVYFTISSLQAVLASKGFEVITHKQFVSEGESLCSAIICKSDQKVMEASLAIDNDIVLNFLSLFPKHISGIASSLSSYANCRTLYLYGANHIAGTFLDIIGDTSELIRAVIDDDTKKSGLTIGICCTIIKSMKAINQDEPLHFLVSVNEGRSPMLYERLRLYFPETLGHRVESLASFCQTNWDLIK